MWRSVLIMCIVGAMQRADGHSFHIGDCPKVQPMSGFDMEKFLGMWYVIQKTASTNKHQVLTYSHGDEAGEYKVVENAVRPIIGRTDYSGKLKPTDEPGLMKVKFKLNPGSYDYIVFMTDYENYAGVFSCQKVLGTNRRAASILSRRPTLEKFHIDKVRDRLKYFDVNPYDLTEIVQNKPTEIVQDKPTEESGRSSTGLGVGDYDPDYEPIWDVDPRFGQATNAPNTSDLHLFKK